MQSSRPAISRSRPTKYLILNDAKVPPFQLEVAGSENLASEDTRLKYRYLDLRRPQLQHNIRMRARTVAKIREYMDSLDFIEIETPILLKSTPEGARDFIVPSRIHTSKFFALPQSPQILKQLTMIAGFDKYYQIARCFRDEDLRADRQPEFTQLDVEMSFANQEMVYRLIEGMFGHVFQLIGVDLPEKWPRMTYAEAMRRYGSDKPDLRFEMELHDLSGELAGTDFAPFADTLADGGEIKCIVVKGKADYSRKQLDELQEFVKRYGAGALAWIKLGDETTSSLLKVLGEEKIGQLITASGAEKGDAVLIVAGRKSVVAAALGALRIEVAKRENLIPANVFKPLDGSGIPDVRAQRRRKSLRCRPSSVYLADGRGPRAVQARDRERGRARSARAGARQGLRRRDQRDRVRRRVDPYSPERGPGAEFQGLGLSTEKARERFGFFLEALEYGTPPHGGFAAGIERTLMRFCRPTISAT